MISDLASLQDRMRSFGAVRFYAKLLAPNDNSKNQVYLGGDFSVLNVLPFREITTDESEIAGSKRDRAKAAVSFSWIDHEGRYDAPGAQLILYPRYPEVRISGFLKGCRNAPSDLMKSRDEGRVLFLGITEAGEILGHVVAAAHSLARAFTTMAGLHQVGVLYEIPPTTDGHNTRTRLLTALREINTRQWISSRIRTADGRTRPYGARNGGGYTLEAELGISPNGYAEPDFLGWEIKQYGVADFSSFRPKSPVTLMTPEPTGGLYRQLGVAEFMKRYGYPDKSGRPDRINFGGIYTCTRELHAETGLRLVLLGYDMATSRISDLGGGVALLDTNDEIAALWQFTGIIEHWNRKHAQAAYIPSLYRTPPPQYSYGPLITLCEQTDLTLFLQAIANGIVYYDPAIKIENASSEKPELKRRSQFRIKHKHLSQMYHKTEQVDLRQLG